MTSQPVPLLHMDAQQLETHRALLQAQAAVAALASHQEGATGGGRGRWGAGGGMRRSGCRRRC